MTSSPPTAPGAARSLAGRLLGAAGSLAVLLVFITAIYVLHRELRSYKLSDIEQSMSQLGWGQLAAAALLTASSYLLLTGYDWLALRYLGRSLAYPRIALASFVSYVCGYNFGAILGGTTMRYRLYSTFGLSPVEIVKVIAFCTLTFVLGYCTLAGVVFVVKPLPIPPIEYLPITTVFPIGVALLSGVAIYLLASGLRTRGLTVRGWKLSLPPIQYTGQQMVIASADLVAAAGVLYVLLPASIEVSFFDFLGIFLIAQFWGIVSHVPGGLGVVEAVLLLMLAPSDKSALMASIVAYRLTYYLAPLTVAVAMLAIHEALRQRTAVARFADMFGRWGPLVVPPLLAVTTFAGGAVLLLTSALPRSFGRWTWAADIVPLPLIEIAHISGAMLGMGLLIVARGLQQRLLSAYHLAVGMLGAGVIAALLRSADVEEALIVATMLAMLIPCRRYFYRRVSLAGEPYTIGWLTATVLVLVGAIWVGLFVGKDDAYSHGLWWQMSHAGDISRMLRAGVGVAVVVLIAAVALWFARGSRGEELAPNQAELAAVAKILESSPRAIPTPLLREVSLRMNAAQTALLQYITRRSTWVSLGDPLGPEAESAELAWQFKEMCESRGGWPAFYQVASDLLPLYVDLGLMVFPLGDVARVSLPEFQLEHPARRELRAAHARAVAESCTFEVVRPPVARALYAECHKLRDAWRLIQGGLAMEQSPAQPRWTAAEARGCPLAVVRRQGEIVAFGIVWQGANREELTVEPAHCGPSAPPETLAYLLVETIEWGRGDGFRWFNLGLAPAVAEETGPLAHFWHEVGINALRYGEHFDSVQSAREFLAQFDPDWSPRFLAAPGGWKLPRVQADLARRINAGRRRAEAVSA